MTLSKSYFVLSFIFFMSFNFYPVAFETFIQCLAWSSHSEKKVYSKSKDFFQ